jgi:hypothetical protein
MGRGQLEQFPLGIEKPPRMGGKRHHTGWNAGGPRFLARHPDHRLMPEMDPVEIAECNGSAALAIGYGF